MRQNAAQFSSAGWRHVSIVGQLSTLSCKLGILNRSKVAASTLSANQVEVADGTGFAVL
jgi:hypothetical protein